MKTWIKTAIIILAVAAVSTIITLSVVLWNTKVYCHHLKRQTEDQTVIIDSLLRRRMTVFDVTLSVTDKSRFAIYGRYNKGTITVPNERTYELKIDSTNVKMR